MEGFCLGMMRVPRGCGMIGSVSSWDKSTHRHTFDPYLETIRTEKSRCRRDMTTKIISIVEECPWQRFALPTVQQSGWGLSTFLTSPQLLSNFFKVPLGVVVPETGERTNDFQHHCIHEEPALHFGFFCRIEFPSLKMNKVRVRVHAMNDRQPLRRHRGIVGWLKSITTF